MDQQTATIVTPLADESRTGGGEESDEDESYRAKATVKAMVGEKETAKAR